MGPLLLVVLALLLELPGLLFLLLALEFLLAVDLDQLKFFLVISLTTQPCARQPSPLVERGLPLQEIRQPFVPKNEHFFALADEAQGEEQIIDSPEAHDLVLDGVVGGLDASVLLLEWVGNDAKWRGRYLAVSLQRMLSPSERTNGSFSLDIESKIASMRFSPDAIVLILYIERRTACSCIAGNNQS